MREYHETVIEALVDGSYKPNRTGVDTIASFGRSYTVDLQDGFPLLTTKKMSGFRWNSMMHEIEWYFSGDEHIRVLREETGIWDEWADEDGLLETAYGRFWRRFPLPESGLPGEAWAVDGSESTVGSDSYSRWVNDDGTFDQIQYVLDTLNENPHSRRMVVSAWHPGNAAVSLLPPCHFTFVVNVQGDDTVNVHLTQRSGDIALGVPFNIATYALLAHVFAGQSEFDVGEFSHTIVDSHIYCGKGERGAWYGENLGELQERVESAVSGSRDEFLEVREWIEEEAPDEADGEDGYDHVPGLLTQLSREPRELPTIHVDDVHPDEFSIENVSLEGYDPYDGLSFSVAE